MSLIFFLLLGASEALPRPPTEQGNPSSTTQSRGERHVPAKKEAARWVVLRTGPRLQIESLEQVRADLEAGLASLGVRVVVAPRPETSSAARSAELKRAAQVTLRRREDGLLTVEIEDYLTNKRLARDLDLQNLPEDGHGLALALAADELLRASWAELDLHHSKKASRSPKDRMEESRAPTVQATEQTRDERRIAGIALLGAAVDHFPTGGTFWGGDLSVGGIWRHWRLEGHFLARDLFTSTVTAGRIDGSALGGGLSLGYDFYHEQTLSFGPQLAIQALRVKLRGQPNADFEGGTLSGLWLSATAGLFLSFQFDRLLLSLDGGAGHTLSAVVAQADGQPVTGATGFELQGTLRAGVILK